MKVGDLVKTKKTYMPGPRPIGIILESKVWNKGDYRGKLSFSIHFVDCTFACWWTEDYLELVNESR